VGASFLPAQFALTDAPALHWAEGSATTVVVRAREGHRELWVEGKIEASTLPTDRLHLALLGALPCALHPAPERVAVIGLGTGRTAQAVAAFAPERLLVMELEPEVVRAVSWFEQDGGGLPAGAEVALGDARRTLAASSERFDVITSDPVHPGVAGSAALYSVEQYALLAERLLPGGIACQWLPLYQHTADDLRLALRTFAAGFEHVLVFQSGEDLILVGSAAPIVVDEAALRARLAGPAGRPLVPLGLATPGRLLRLVLADGAGARRFAGPGPLNEDDRLLLEFQAGRSWFVQTPYENLLLLRVRRPDPAALLAAAPSDAFRAEVELAARHDEGIRAWLSRDPARAADAFAALAAHDAADGFASEMRDDCRLLAFAARAEDDPDAVLADLRALAKEPQLTARQRLDAAQLLLDLGAEEEGRALALSVLEQTGSPRARRLAAP
jgi:spermidine synthase